MAIGKGLRVWTVLKIAAGLLVTLAVGAVAGVLVLTRTNVGQVFVVEEALRRMQGSFDGEITIAGLHSPGLHRAATLLDLRVTAPDSSQILAVDSVEAEYSMAAMLSGDVALTGLTLWGPRLTITREAPDQPFNLAAFLDGTESLELDLGDTDELTEAGVRFLFEDVDIRDGSIDVRYPLTAPPDPTSRFLSEPGREGRGFVRVIGFQGIDGHVDGVVVADPAVGGLTMNVRDFAFEGRILQDLVQVENLDGSIVWSGDRISVAVETVGLLGATATGSGAVDLGDGDQVEFTFDGVVESLDLSELRWLEPRLPDARASARIGVEYGSEGLRATWSDGQLPIDGGNIEGEGTVRVVQGGETSFEDVTLAVLGVPVSTLEEFIPLVLPLEGRLSGTVELSGTMDAMRVISRMDLVEPDLGPTSGEIDGVFHLRGPLGVTGLTARLIPLDLGLVNRFAEGLLLDGSAIIDVQVDGRLDSGMRVVAVAVDRDPPSEPSNVYLQGLVTEVEGEIRASFDAELTPLSITGVLSEESSLSRFGPVRGTAHAEGSLQDLQLQTDLTSEEGRLTLESRFDARSPFSSYRLRGEAENFDPLEVAPWLPEGTVLSGGFDLSGEGDDLRTAELVGTVRLDESRLADLTFDSVTIQLGTSNGILTVDDFQGLVGGVTVEAAGQLPVSGSGGPEDVRVSFGTESLEGLRPLLRGDGDVIAGDTLTALERQILELEGIDPDTLPTLAEVLFSGRMTGELTVGGSLENVSVRGRTVVNDVLYEGNRVRQAAISFSATDLLSPAREASAQIDAGAIRLLQREFDSVSVNVRYQEPRGIFNVFVARSPDEGYSGLLAFDVEDDLRTLHLDELVFRFPEERWNLGGPATIAWDPDGLTFRDFRMRRPGVGGMRLQAQGRVPFDGEADFVLEAEALDIRWIANLLQLDEVLEGVVDLDLRATGTDAEPVMVLDLSTDGFRFREYVLDRLEANVDYADRRAAGEVGLWSDSLQILTLDGELPLDLSFNAVEDRFPQEVIDLVVVSDRLPLSLLMAPFPVFGQVVGTMSGSVDVGGTSRSLAPRGQISVDGGGAFLGGLGVGYEAVSGTLDWFPDGRVVVDLGAQALGTASIGGTVTVTTLLDPGFDIDIHLEEFQALDRRDAAGRVSGDLRLEGSFSRPVVSGDLFLDGGTLFYEEFQRSAQAADLFFARSSGLADFQVVDTTASGFAPFVAVENPFIQNIRMENTTLTARRDNWIRSEQMNVELEGDLDLLYDRQTQDLVLVGALEAVRGSLSFGPRSLRKQFQVDGGTVRFLGASVFNPDLDITASEPVRTPEGDRLTIVAGVTGTLLAPRVTLSSDEPGFSEDDLLSYLWFGRPTYALNSGQSDLVGAGMAVGLSVFNSGLGTVMTQGLGLDFLDYLSITQQSLGSLGSLSANSGQGALSTTVVETGLYVADDLFLTLLFRPAAAQGGGLENWPGIRMEWVASRGYTIQSYFEDQFFRGRSVGFGAFGVQTKKGLGLSIFRNWVY